MNDRQKSVLFGVILVIVTLVLGEVSLRAVQYLVSGTSPLAMLPQYRERRFLLSPFLIFGPRVDWQIPGKPNPDTAYFNPQGFRTRERVGPKPPGEVRIIALGGSTTEDVWNEDGLHWPLWTERELQKAGLNVRVYNTGMSAYTSAHSLIRLAFDVLDYEPDFVIEMQNINDLTVNYRAAIAGVSVDGHYRVPFAQKAFTGDIDESDIVLSRLAHTVRARLTAEPDHVVPADYDISRGLTYFRRNLGNIHALTANRQASLVLLTMPVCDAEAVYRKVVHDGRRGHSAPVPESFERFKRDFAAYNDTIRDVGTSKHAAVVDMNHLLGGDERWFSDFVHYNAAGSRRFGELLASELAPLIRERLARRSGPSAM